MSKLALTKGHAETARGEDGGLPAADFAGALALMPGEAFTPPVDRRQSPTATAICRGTGRLLRRHGFVCVPEVPLPDGRRADLLALGPKGDIWIVEIKSSLADFQSDRKWQAYRTHCDRLFFAVTASFPTEVLPEEAGLVVADAYDAAILREADEHRIATTLRRNLTLLVARLASARLHQVLDPDGRFAGLDGLP